METMYTVNTKNFQIVWEIEPDNDVDISFDKTNETRDKLKSGEWQAFTSRVACIYRPTGAMLAEDYFGGSIYDDPAKFRDHIGARGRWGRYFRDMVRTVCHEARKVISDMQLLELRRVA